MRKIIVSNHILRLHPGHLAQGGIHGLGLQARCGTFLVDQIQHGLLIRGTNAAGRGWIGGLSGIGGGLPGGIISRFLIIGVVGIVAGLRVAIVGIVAGFAVIVIVTGLGILAGLGIVGTVAIIGVVTAAAVI